MIFYKNIVFYMIYVCSGKTPDRREILWYDKFCRPVKRFCFSIEHGLIIRRLSVTYMFFEITKTGGNLSRVIS